METVFSSMIIGGLTGLLGVLVLALLLPRKNCPNCSHPLPRLRIPTSFREAMLSGWRCQHCDAPVTNRGALRSE